VRRALLATFLGAITLFAPSSVRADPDVRPTAQMHIGGAVLDVFIAPGPRASTQAEVLAWIGTAAQAVSHYYGRFPVPQACIRGHRRVGLASTPWVELPSRLARLEIENRARFTVTATRPVDMEPSQSAARPSRAMQVATWQR
jgi:hypothetical protein